MAAFLQITNTDKHTTQITTLQVTNQLKLQEDVQIFSHENQTWLTN